MDSAKISCGTIFDISMVGQKYPEFKDALVSQSNIQISAGELQKIDGAGIQLLVSFFKEAEKSHKEVIWDDISDVLENSARLLGVDKVLRFDNQN